MISQICNLFPELTLVPNRSIKGYLTSLMLFEFSVESLRDLLAKMKHNNHNHVFICVQSPETKNHYRYIYRGSKSSSIKPTVAGRRIAQSVARDPCAEALQRTRVRLPARVPLLRVTPRLLPCFLSNSSAVLSKIKPEKAKKILKKKKNLLWRRTDKPNIDSRDELLRI